MEPAGTVTMMLALPAPVTVVESKTKPALALVIVTETPPGGAAAPRAPFKFSWRSFPTVVLAMLIGGGGITVMAAVTSLIPVALARKLVGPPRLTPVTVMGAEVWP